LIVGRVVAAPAARETLRGADVDDADVVHRLGLRPTRARDRCLFLLPYRELCAARTTRTGQGA
jgi:hypothetical protein